LIVGTQPEVPDMSHYAYNSGRAKELECDSVANWIPIPKGPLCHDGVNHNYRFVANLVVFVEKAALEEFEAHDFWIARRNQIHLSQGYLIRWRRAGACPVADLLSIGAHRNDIGYGRGFHAWDMPDAIKDVSPGRPSARGIRQGLGGKRDLRDQHVVRIETWIERRQAQEGTAEHSGGDQEYNRDCHLGDNKAAVKTAGASCDGPRAST